MGGFPMIKVNTNAAVSFPIFSSPGTSAIPNAGFDQLTTSVSSNYPASESTLINNFFAELRLRLSDDKIDFAPLNQVINIMRHSNNPLIKSALTKSRGYTGRLFSTESWAEWAENRTSLGRVVDKLASYMEDPEHNGFRIDQATALFANQQATELLSKLDQGNDVPAITIEEQLVFPSYQKIITTAVQLAIQNMVGIRAGLSASQMTTINLATLSSNVFAWPRVRATVNTGPLEIGDATKVFFKNLAGETVEKIGTIVSATTDKILVRVGEYGDVWIDKIGDKLLIGADHVLRGTEIMLERLVPRTIRTFSENIEPMARGFVAGAWEGLFGPSAVHGLIKQVKLDLQNCQNFEGLHSIFEFIQGQTQNSLSAGDKVRLYQEVINFYNVPEIDRYDHDTVSVLAYSFASNDGLLKASPGLLKKALCSSGLIDCDVQAVIDSVPSANIRTLLTAGNHSAIDERLALGKSYAERKATVPPKPEREKHVDNNTLVSNIGFIYLQFTPEIPEGYLPCDGREYKVSDYPELYKVIGDRYSKYNETRFDENGNRLFQVPDPRSVFFRISDNGAGRDPDVASRRFANGTIGGDQIGTFQDDALRAHSHSYYRFRNVNGHLPGHGYAGSAKHSFDVNNMVETGHAGGNETRPQNVAIGALIKVGPNSAEKKLKHRLDDSDTKQKTAEINHQALQQTVQQIRAEANDAVFRTNIVAGVLGFLNALLIVLYMRNYRTNIGRSRVTMLAHSEPSSDTNEPMDQQLQANFIYQNT